MIFYEELYPELVDVSDPIMLEGGTVVMIRQSPDCLPPKGSLGIQPGHPSQNANPCIIPYRLSHCCPPCHPKYVSPCRPSYRKPQCVMPYRPICIPQCVSPKCPIYPYPWQPQSSCIPIYGRPQCLTPYRPICVNPCQQSCYPPCVYPRPQICGRPSYLYPQKPCYPYYGYPCASQCGQLSPCDYLEYDYLF